MLVAASQTIAVHRQEVGHSRLHPIMGHVNSAPLSTECASERPGIFLSCQRLLGGGQGVVGEGMTSFLLRLGGEFNLNLCLISFDCMRYLISETVAPMSPWSLGRVSSDSDRPAVPSRPRVRWRKEQAHQRAVFTSKSRVSHR